MDLSHCKWGRGAFEERTWDDWEWDGGRKERDEGRLGMGRGAI